jgi:hypothetical protein
VSRCRWRGGGRRIDADVGPLLHAARSAAGGAPQHPRPDPAAVPARAAGSSHLAHMRESTRPGGEDEVVEGEKAGSTPSTTKSHPASPDPAPTEREGGMGRAAVVGDRGRGAAGSSGLNRRVQELGRHRSPWLATWRRATSSVWPHRSPPRMLRWHGRVRAAPAARIRRLPLHPSAATARDGDERGDDHGERGR